MTPPAATNNVFVDDDDIITQQEIALRNGDEDLREESRLDTKTSVDNSSVSTSTANVPVDSNVSSKEFNFVPLTMGGGGRTHVVSEASRRMMQEENVTVEALQSMTDLFYEKAFQDQTLDKFIRSHDDPHGSRFAKWIHQKLSGSNVWDQDRRRRDLRPVQLAGGYRHVVHDRSSAHAAAWHSPKRPAKDVGNHFNLEECRVWMRLHFWALRDSGMMERAPSFADYYVRFIGHFVRVYENSAPMFARESLRWSADPRNIEAYLANGRRMSDVLGQSQEDAELQLPEEEANDFEWPYNQSPR